MTLARFNRALLNGVRGLAAHKRAMAETEAEAAKVAASVAASTAQVAKGASDVVATVVKIADEVPPILNATARRFVTLRATAETHLSATTASTRLAHDEVVVDINAMLDSIGSADFKLEEYVARQDEKIAAIRDLGYGGYLDEYARAFLRLSSGEELSPQRRSEYQRTLMGTEQFVRMAGVPGREFDFAALQGDLLQLLRDSRQALRETSRRAGKPGGGVNGTGRSGSPESGCEGKGNPFSDALKVGGWTGGN